MAVQFVRPATAFASPRQKQQKVPDSAHLAFIRGTWCVICGAPNPDPAHLRAGNMRYGKRETGGGQKPKDRWVTPLCRKHHDEQHDGDELAFWQRRGIDPFVLAIALYEVSGDDEMAAQIIREARG